MKSRHTKRAWWHDYREPSKYLITINKLPGAPDFGILSGDCHAPRGSNNFPFIRYYELGVSITREILKIPKMIPGCGLYQYMVMPDHIHILINVRERLPMHLGFYISKLKNNIRKAIGYSTFEPGFNDKIIDYRRDLNDVFQYLKDNPYRLAVRLAHPEYFERNDHILINGRRFMAYGNLSLLYCPFKEAVIVHRRYTMAEREQYFEKWLHLSESGFVMVSAFISKAEKKVKGAVEEAGGGIVLIKEKPFPAERYKPARHDFEQCAKGELVILAPAEEDWSRGVKPIPREACLKMNELADYLSGSRKAGALLCGPGGSAT